MITLIDNDIWGGGYFGCELKEDLRKLNFYWAYSVDKASGDVHIVANIGSDTRR